jgi:hypothetical protein
VVTFGLAASALVLIYATSATGKGLHFNDFYRESWPAYSALVHGHPLGFLRLAPTYFGSLVLRAPFAVIPTIWSGGSRAIYFASAVPCMLAVVGFCAWLAAQPRRRGGITPASRIGPIIYCVVSPIVLVALLAGHPEDVLGAVLCVAAVLLAANSRAEWAGLLIGLAVVNKSWALVAVPVVLAVLPTGRRRASLVAAGTAAIVLLPIMAARDHGFSAAATGVTTTTGATTTAGHPASVIFNPPELLWWFGAHSWIAREARPLIVVIAAVCALLWWAQRVRARPATDPIADALLLLALVLLLRAALDPWNNIYYHVPFLFALTAYEVRSGRMPLLAVLYSVLLLLIVPNSRIPPMSHDLRAAVYALAVAPLIAWMVSKLYRPRQFLTTAIPRPSRPRIEVPGMFARRRTSAGS